MLDNQDKPDRKLNRGDHDMIRYLRSVGLTVPQIAKRLRVTEDAVIYRLRRYGLDEPVGELDAVRLQMQAAFRETNRRLEADSLSTADHARLCATQIRQALALVQVISRETILEDPVMSKESEAEKQRILALSDEEAMDELRRVAGLEHKKARPRQGAAAHGGRSLAVESISGAGDESTKAADG